MSWRRCTLGAALLISGCVTGDPGNLTVNTIELVTTRDDGVADSQVIPIIFEGEEAWLALDTGAPFTFIFRESTDPEFVDDAATIVLVVDLGGATRTYTDWIVTEYSDDAPADGLVTASFTISGPTQPATVYVTP